MAGEVEPSVFTVLMDLANPSILGNAGHADMSGIFITSFLKRTTGNGRAWQKGRLLAYIGKRVNSYLPSYEEYLFFSVEIGYNGLALQAIRWVATTEKNLLWSKNRTSQPT